MVFWYRVITTPFGASVSTSLNTGAWLPLLMSLPFMADLLFRQPWMFISIETSLKIGWESKPSMVPISDSQPWQTNFSLENRSFVSFSSKALSWPKAPEAILGIHANLLITWVNDTGYAFPATHNIPSELFKDYSSSISRSRKYIQVRFQFVIFPLTIWNSRTMFPMAVALHLHVLRSSICCAVHNFPKNFPNQMSPGCTSVMLHLYYRKSLVLFSIVFY